MKTADGKMKKCSCTLWYDYILLIIYEWLVENSCHFCEKEKSTIISQLYPRVSLCFEREESMGNSILT